MNFWVLIVCASLSFVASLVYTTDWIANSFTVLSLFLLAAATVGLRNKPTESVETAGPVKAEKKKVPSIKTRILGKSQIRTLEVPEVYGNYLERVLCRDSMTFSRPLNTADVGDYVMLTEDEPPYLLIEKYVKDGKIRLKFINTFMQQKEIPQHYRVLDTRFMKSDRVPCWFLGATKPIWLTPSELIPGTFVSFCELDENLNRGSIFKVVGVQKNHHEISIQEKITGQVLFLEPKTGDDLKQHKGLNKGRIVVPVYLPEGEHWRRPFRMLRTNGAVLAAEPITSSVDEQSIESGFDSTSPLYCVGVEDKYVSFSDLDFTYCGSRIFLLKDFVYRNGETGHEWFTVESCVRNDDVVVLSLTEVRQ